MDNINESTVSGFSTYNTCRFEGFTERNAADLMEILNSIESSEKFKKLSTLYETLKTHLLTTDGAHTFSLTEMNDDVIRTLYTLYRKHGYKGSSKDMLFSVIKTVEIGNKEDIAAGMNKEKAETAVDFNKLLVEHYNKEYAHRNISDTITPTACVNKYPYVVFDSYYAQKSVEVYNLLDAGTIFFEYRYVKNKNQGELFNISFDACLIKVVATSLGVDVVLDNHPDTSHTSNVILHLDYPKDLKMNKYVFSFDKYGVYFRDEINSIRNTSVVLSAGRLLSLPDNSNSIVGSGNSRSDGIRKIYVYDCNLSDEEKTYLLN